MKPPETPAWLDARLEAYLDGDLPPAEHDAFERAAFAPDAEAAWDAELFLARQIRDGLRALPQPACPPRLTDAVLARARHQARADRSQRLRAWIARHWAAWWQPALAMTVLLALVLSATLVERAEPALSPEVARARAEVEWTLAYLSEVGRQTGRTVRHDVIEMRVVSPVQDAFGGRRKRSDATQR